MKLQEIQRKIRIQKDLLATNGYGIIIFVLWSFVKSIISVQPVTDVPSNEIEATNEIMAIVIAVIAIFLSLILLEIIVAIFTGIFAIREGQKDKKAGIKLRISAIILSLFGLIFVLGDVLFLIQSTQFTLALILSVIVDFVYYLFSVIVIVSAFKLNKLYRLEKEALNEC